MPYGALIRMLHKVAEQTGHELVLPEFVVEEYLAHYRHKVDVVTNKARDAIDALRHLYPSWPGEAPSFGPVAEMAETDCREKLGQIFRTHPTPGGALQKGLLREARREPPAKRSWDKPGSGARDVVIWLTILDACKASDIENYFVTANGADFGKEGSLWPELVQDLHDELGQKAGLFHYCADIPMLMDQLSIERVPPPDDATIGSAAPVRTAVEAAVTEGQAWFEFMPGIGNDLAMKFVSAFEAIRDLRFERLQGKVEAYRIGGSVWASARGKWAGWKDFSVTWKPEFVPSAQSRIVRVDFTVNATVVMQLGQDGVISDAEVVDRSRIVIVEQQESE